MIQYNFGKTDFKYNLFIKFTLNSLLNLKKSIPDRLKKLKLSYRSCNFNKDQLEFTQKLQKVKNNYHFIEFDKLNKAYKLNHD